jgi:methionyl aminopeptidase
MSHATDQAETATASDASSTDPASLVADFKIEEDAEGSDSDGEGDDAGLREGGAQASAASGPAKKKKKKPKKKKAAVPKDASEVADATPNANQQPAKAKSTKAPTEQTDPPTIPLSQLFPNKQYPLGEVHEYADK